MEKLGSCRCRCVGKISIPPGFKFNPTEIELVEFYLKRKSASQQLPYNDFVRTNLIKDVELYAQSPDKLIAADLNNLCPGKAQYFFTKLSRKYENGNRPNRLAGDGYWKRTGTVEPIEYNKDIIGYRRSFNFLRGTPKESIKTKWKMKEFVLKDPPKQMKNVATKLDDWVLCKLYMKEDSKNKNKKKNKKNKKKKKEEEEEEEDQITRGDDDRGEDAPGPDPPPHPLEQQQQLSKSEFNQVTQSARGEESSYNFKIVYESGLQFEIGIGNCDYEDPPRAPSPTIPVDSIDSVFPLSPPHNPLEQQQQFQSEINRDWCAYASIDMLSSSVCNELLSSSECNELLSSSECDELLKFFNFFQFPPL